MQPYSVYVASFTTTKWKTKRKYIGSAISIVNREVKLQDDSHPEQPQWLKAGHENFVIKVPWLLQCYFFVWVGELVKIKEGRLMVMCLLMRSNKEELWSIPGRPAALVLECMVAAPMILKEDKTVRGACWSNRKLTDSQMAEIREVARCSSTSEVLAVAQKYPNGSLMEHLKDLKFGVLAASPASSSSSGSPPRPPASKPKAKPKPAAKQANAVPQAAVMMQAKTSPLSAALFGKLKKEVPHIRRKRSGVDGNTYRIANGMAWPDEDFQRHKFGNNAAKNHNASTQRWRAMKAMKGMKVIKTTRKRPAASPIAAGRPR